MDYQIRVMSFNLINLLINCARTRRALGAIFSKGMSPPSACPSVVGLFAPLCRPRANIHRFCCAPGTLQKSALGWSAGRRFGVGEQVPVPHMVVFLNGGLLHSFLEWIQLSERPWARKNRPGIQKIDLLLNLYNL